MDSCERTRIYAIRRFPTGCGRLFPVKTAQPSESESENENENHFQHLPFSREDISAVNVISVAKNKPIAANDTVTIRDRVQEVLKLYNQILKKVESDDRSKPGKSKNIHEYAAMILRRSHKWINTEKRLGPVPGVEIGDNFQFRAELNIIGLHRQFQKGIDYMEKDGVMLATSIVSTTKYDNYMKSSDVLIYNGEGGNPKVRNRHPLKDQVLEQGNLSLKNSMELKTPVRVILSDDRKSSKLQKRFTGRKNSATTIYFYDGLYLVEKLWQERGEFDKLVFKFQLRRIAEQPRAFIHKSRTYASGPLMNDISGGKEKLPIAVINTVDNERPLPFTYITHVSYTGVQGLSLSIGCDCTDGCLNSKDCSCKTKNGQESPFDNCKSLIRKIPCIYECGPFCKCSDSCTNRVSQLGIQFQLEVFKTASKGWGVRSRSYIRAGSFICEYIGQIQEAKEAEQGFDRNEYLFDVGDNHDDDIDDLCNSKHLSLREKDGSFTIDAAQCSNIGRFINHSCSPNLYVQNVFYDHHDRRMPHIMLFAKEDIPFHRELTYDYNCRLGKVRHKNGAVKAKNCMCKSTKCVGKFY